MSTPEIVTRYVKAAEAGDAAALVACFTTEGEVLDEGNSHRGHAEILAWREDLAAKWSYTAEVTGSELVSPDTYRVTERVEGNFPGGVADLGYTFTLDGGLIAALTIG
jgi:ketosteroid isomerase-like protein